MLLADRGFANHELMGWLQASRWHYCLRLPCDVLLHGASKYPRLVGNLYPPLEKLACTAKCVYGQSECIAVISSWRRFREPESWAVVTDHLANPWQYALRFQVEELFGIASQAHLRSEDSRYALVAALERLYRCRSGSALCHHAGMSVQIAGFAFWLTCTGGAALATSRWGCAGFTALSIRAATPAPDCVVPKRPTKKVASNRRSRDFYDQIWFTRIRSLTCKP